MRLFRAPLFLVLFWMALPVPVSEAASGEIDYRASFERALHRIRGEGKSARETLCKRYGNSLDRVLLSVKKQGDLDKVLLVRKEKQRAAGGVTIPPDPPQGFTQLEGLWKKARLGLRDLAVREARAVDKLATDYDSALDRKERDATRRDKIEAAVAIRDVRRELAAHSEVVAARALLREKRQGPTDATLPTSSSKPAPAAPVPALKPVVLEATAAKRIGKLPVHDDPPRVGVHFPGSALDWGKQTISPGRYVCAVTYSSSGRADAMKGTVEVSVGDTLLAVDVHGTVGWGTPKRVALGTVAVRSTKTAIVLRLRSRNDNVPAVCDVWRLELTPAAELPADHADERR